MSAFKNWMWNKDEQTVRGSFVNIALTIIYLLFITSALIWPTVAKNLEKMTTFMLGFYGLSFTIWAGKKTVEVIKGAREIMPTKYGDMLSQIFDKVSVSVESKPEQKSTEERAAEKEAAK